MITHMTHITRLTPLSHLDTGGVQILDLRGSSEPTEPASAPAPVPEAGSAAGEPPRPL
jgi:hypothetical protein